MRTRAIRIESLGPPEALVEREVELPDPGEGELHIEVHASGVNFADLLQRVGLYGTCPPRPYAPGFEVAGVVSRVGPGVQGWSEGDQVISLLRHGGYARDAIAPVKNCFPLPSAMGFVQGAAMPVVFLTAWACLFGVGRAAAGERVMVLGAAGGVGTAAVQLARANGLEVLGTAGTVAKRQYVVEELGAAACFDSRGDWADEMERWLGDRKLDIALDPVGGRGTAALRDHLAPFGRLVFFGLSEALPGQRRNWLKAAWAWLRTPRFHPAQLIQPNLSVSGVHLLHLGEREDLLRAAAQELLPRFEAGELRCVVDSTFPLDRDGAVAAHRRLHARENVGKVVLVR